MSRQYKVSARKREHFGGFNRGGYRFPNEPEYLVLSEEHLTDEINDEPMLIVREVREKPEPPVEPSKPAEPSEPPVEPSKPGTAKPLTDDEVRSGHRSR